MDSIVKQRNDGFDKDGNFLNGQTQLLPWPERVMMASYYNLAATNLDRRYMIPSAYEFGVYYSVTHQIINKHDSSGAIISAHPMASIWASSYRFTYLHCFYDDGIKKWLLGSSEDINGNARIFKIEINGTTSHVSQQIEHKAEQMGVLESGALYFSSNSAAYTLNPDDLSVIKNIPNLGYQTFNDNINSSGTQSVGASLFNGSVLILNTYLGSSYVMCHIAINSNLDFTEPSSKFIVRTAHCIANNAFYGQIRQLSKNLFYMESTGTSPAASLDPSSYFHGKIYTRAELEKWVSNSVFAVTGFRIPLNTTGA